MTPQRSTTSHNDPKPATTTPQRATTIHNNLTTTWKETQRGNNDPTTIHKQKLYILFIVMQNCNWRSFWGCCGWLWIVALVVGRRGSFGSLWIVVTRCGWLWIIVDRCGSLWGRCRSLWLVPCFSNYDVQLSAPSIQVLAIRYQFNGFGVFWDTLYISYNNVA
jgi:hypothetical protein